MKLPVHTALHVSLRWQEGQGEQRVGRLAWRDRSAWFEFEADFLRSGLNPSPLRLPVRPGVRGGEATFGGLHGLFHDSLPDAWGRLLVDRRAQAHGIEPATLTPLDRLAMVGERGMGALVYRPDHAPPMPDDTPSLDELSSQARRLLEGSAREVLPALLAAGGSPGGARPKVLLGWRPGDGHLVHGAERTPAGYTPVLVKFGAPSDPADIGPIELAYARMAVAAGLRMMPSRLLDSGTGPGYFATDRFDRPQPNARVHVHTLAGLLHADHRLPSLDYDALLRVTRHLTRDERELRQAFRLMVFNVAAHNRDDHAKQFSFMMSQGGEWRLAPAYDLTFSEGPGGEHSTSVQGEGRRPTRAHLLGLAASAGVSGAEQIIEEVVHVVSGWAEFARDAGVSSASATQIQGQISGVSRDCARAS